MLKRLVLFLGCFSLPVFAQTPHLNLFTWDDYIDPNVIEIFERRHGIKIIITTYTDDLDRDQVTASSGGEGLDLILIDDSSINSYVRNNWIDVLDVRKLPNRKYLDWDAVSLKAAEKKYVQPYAEGSFGIFYRKDIAAASVASWSVLFDPPKSLNGKIALPGQPTELMPAVLLYLGYDHRTPPPPAMNLVEDTLMKLRPNIALFSSDAEELSAAFVDERLIVAAGYSSDLKLLRSANKNIAFSIPKEGGFYWLDSLTIAKKSRAKDAAYRFLNFLLEPEIATRQMIYNYALIPHPQAIRNLPVEELSELQATHLLTPSLHRFEDANIWSLRHMMSIWYSLDTKSVRQ